MADVPTPAELAKVAQQAFAIALDPNGTGAVNLNPGSRNDTMISVVTAVGHRVARYTSNRLAASNVSSATVDDLGILGETLYSLPRKGDVAAVGTVYLQRTGTGQTSIPLGSRVGVPSGPGRPTVTFSATSLVSVATGVLKVAVPVQCTVTGTAGNVSLADVTSIIDQLPDTSWSLYVPVFGDPILGGGTVDAIGGGAPAEDDDTYRARLKQSSIDDSNQRGTKTAILASILSTPGIAYCTVVEPFDGTLIAYVGDLAYSLPNALKSVISTNLLEWRTYGIPVLLRPYNAQKVTVVSTIYMSRPTANYDLNAIQVAARAALTAYFQNRPQPDEYFINAIEAALFKAHPEVQDVVVTSPATDQLRPADTGYGSISALNRYYLTDASVSLNVQPPQTS